MKSLQLVRLGALISCSLLFTTAGLAQIEQLVPVADPEGGIRLEARIGDTSLLVHRTSHAVFQPALRTIPGSSVLAATWTEAAGDGPQAYYALSLDGRSFYPARATSYELKLRRAEFDPMRGEPAIAATLAAAPDSRLYVVQYWTQGLEEYRQIVRALGGEIHLFLAWHANVVEMDRAAAARVRELPFVRWVGPFHPSYKLEEALLAEQWRGWSEEESRRLNLLTLRRGPDGHAPVARFIEEIGGIVEDAGGPTYLMSATLTLEQVAALARHDGVQWIDRWSAPEEDMDIARAFHGADYVETVAGYTGSGVRVEVMDGGCDEIHPDLQNFAVHGGNTPSAHGTATSGIVAGSGFGNFSARGAMPDAFLAIADYSFFSGGSRYNHTGELQNPALSWKAVLQSNSWGSSRTASYNSISQDMDLILFDHDRISILQSQSNAGNQQSRPQAWAKNIIAVGGIRHQNTLTESDDSWSGGASIGPAADGRIKPDLASFYDSTLCTDQVGTAGYASGNYYCCFGGTSGATPIVAGHLGLLYEMWSDGLFGNPTPGATVFDNRPFNTTAKALLINTSSQWTFSGTGHDLTRVHQGWGRPDLQKAYDRRNDMFIVDETDVLVNLDSTSYTVNVAAGAPELKVTMVYRDNPGTTSSSLHRINDLDLKVTSPGGTVYWGNNGLTAANYSASGGSANTVDTVENVFIQSPTTGSWTVEVIASELNQDTHVETGALDADYALVVSGATAGPPAAPVAEFVGNPLSGDAPLNVSFTDQSTGSITSWSWDFGDTNTSTAQNPNHTYTAAGNYTVSLTVTGPGGSDDEIKVGYINVTAPQPPAAPSGLTATAQSGSEIALSWTDNSGNEDEFVIERSLDGVGFGQIATVGADVTSYDDTGLTALTTYYYRVFASNAAGNSGYSNVASDTTLDSTVDDVANGEIAVSGTIGGSYPDTHSDDDGYQTVRERESGGKPADRHSFLEHKWTFDVAGGTAVTLHVQAHQTASTDGDNFVFAWSTDDANYTDAVTVTKTADDDLYQTASIPTSVSGTVYVRVRDTDQTQGNRALDTIFVDHLFIRSSGSGGGQPPLAPSGLSAVAASSSRIDLGWTDHSSDEDGFELERSLDGASWSALDTTGANATTYSNTGLSANTTYFYRARAFNAFGNSAWSNTASATTPPAGTVEHTANGEIPVSGTVSGSYVNTTSNDLVYESITERESGGKPSNRHSFLEHKWTIPVTSGTSHLFRVKAHHTASPDGDDFVFAWSADDVSYTDMLTVTKTSDDGQYQEYAFPGGLSGTIFIRVRDTDQTQGNRDLDTVLVDHLYIQSQ